MDVQIHPHTEVTGIQSENGGVTGVNTNRGLVSPPIVGEQAAAAVSS